MAKVEFKFDDRKLRRNVRRFGPNFRRNLSAVTDRRAAITQADLRIGAPWTDNTGAARSGLFALALHSKNAEEIFMAYSVTYGVWLEVAHDRKYAIITPMMRIAGAALMRDLQGLLDRMNDFR